VTSQQKPRILVIDDDPDIQTLVATLFDNAGLETVPALNAAEGAAILRQAPLPDCLVLDLMLPDVSGLELLRQLRAKSVFDAMPVVILSALADPDQIRQGLAFGADRYVTKPYLVNTLTKTVFEVMRGGRRTPTD
jgi:two-component system, OmpR family, phosphate regulon response regulator PhoB